MPYCRRCGTQLEENARFCHKCGTPVVTYIPPAAPVQPAQSKPLRKEPLIVIGIGLVVILVTAAVIVAFLAAPFGTWSTSQPYQDNSTGIKTLNLNFESDIGRVNLTPQKIGENTNILLYVTANGTRGISGGNNIPLTVTFDSRTAGDVLTVNAKVSIENHFTSMSHVQCDIFFDPALKLNLNVTSNTGQISFTGDKAATIQGLNLHATTGEVGANLESNTTVTGNITLSTTTGAVNYRMSQTTVFGNNTINLHSTLGAVNMDIIQTKTLAGNLQVNAQTTTGAINVGLTIDNGVAAKITSQTSGLGNVHATKNNFSGSNSPIQSNNYPAASNIEINNHVEGLGSININANYLTTVLAS